MKNFIQGFFCFLFLMAFTEIRAQIISQMAPLSVNHSGTVDKGYIFVTNNLLAANGPYPTSLAMLDSVGNYVFFKPMTTLTSPPYNANRTSDFKLQPSGLLSYSTNLASGVPGMYLLDSNFAVVDSIHCVNGVNTDGHDMIHLPDGSWHLLGTEEREMDLSALLTADGQTGSSTAVVTGNIVQRLDAQKNLVFEWKSLDYFSLSDVYRHFFTDPTVLDHSHVNSLDIDSDGNYLISFRHLHEITKIDAHTGAIIWRLGGKNNDFTFVGDTMLFSAQHDARRIANGNITIFDNGAFNTIPQARALEYTIDETTMTATSVWKHLEPNGLSSAFIGNTQRLTNGNTLINWGGAFPLPVGRSMVEVDSTGTPVMTLDYDPVPYATYRAVKHQLPFQIKRPEISCNGTSLTLSAPQGYEQYWWSTGATTATVDASLPGTYQVWVNQGIGFLSSLPYTVTNLSTDCTPSGVSDIATPVLEFYPNPVRDIITVEYQGHNTGKLLVRDLLGRVVAAEDIYQNIDHQSIQIPLGELQPGIYFLGMNNVQKRFIKL